MTATSDDSNVPAAAAADDQEKWLVIDQLAREPVNFSGLLSEIHRDFGLDPYSARQRLLGRGYNLLLRGRSDKLSPLLPLLTAHAIAAHLLVPDPSRKHPVKLQSLRQSGSTLVLISDNTELAIDGDSHVVAVFADLSGTVVARGVKQLLVRHAYQGADAAAQQPDEAVLCQAISKAQPVLDLYLLDPQGEVKGAVRALPGRYDPTGLGAKRSLRAGLNLLALIELARSHAGSLTLRSDFGLANLPGCQLDTPLTAANLDKNLVSLSRFGRLAAQFSGQKRNDDQQPDKNAGVASNRTPPASEVSPLPPPPEGRGELRRQWLYSWADGLGVVLIIFVSTAAGMSRGQIKPWFWQTGMTSGLVPGLVAIFLFWRGFAAVRLKRMIENTPVSRIRSLSAGMVEVLGRAERCYALVTPVTRIPCIYYRLRRYRREERNGDWRLTSQSSSGLHPFWLRDATGKVLVDPLAADLRPASRQEGRGAGLSNGFLARESSPDGDEKWEEECIPEGETLYVLGFSAPRRSYGESLHAATVAQLRTLKQSQELRQRFDQNGDGEIDAEEWDEARRVTADEVAKKHLAGREQRRKQEESLLIGAPPRRSLPFFIAQSLNEKAITRALWWRAFVFFLAGLILTIWALRQLFHFLPASGY
jgi:hypothetical protein